MHPLYPHTWCQFGSSPPPNVYPKQQNHCLNIQKSKPALESAKSRGESKLKSLLSTEFTLSPSPPTPTPPHTLSKGERGTTTVLVLWVNSY